MAQTVLPEDEVYNNKVFSGYIHTVTLRNASWELSEPLIDLNSKDKLQLDFDDLSGQTHSYGYTLIHCNEDWKTSELSEQEYLKGFSQGIIRESENSFNTTYDFVHYRLVFPEEDVTPVLSGNYVIVVYNADDPDEIILTRRFYVVEKRVTIEARVKQPPPGDDYETGQQLEFSILPGNFQIRDPNSELSVILQQNDRTDNEITCQKPLFIKPDRLDYAYSDGNIFDAGNEFRTVDLKSRNYVSEHLDRINFQPPYYHFFLKPDEVRADKPYFYVHDLNGDYYIDKEGATDKELEPDYVYVHFTLKQAVPFAGDDVYVFGGLSDWSCGDNNRMTYNLAEGCYQLTLLLKQGLYDYEYVLKNKNEDKIDSATIEGDFYETSNDYYIYVYYHDPNRRYDRLIGYLPIKPGGN